MPSDLSKPFIKNAGVGAFEKYFHFSNVHPAIPLRGSISVLYKVILSC